MSEPVLTVHGYEILQEDMIAAGRVLDRRPRMRVIHERVAALRLGGMTFREIGEAIDTSGDRALQLYERVKIVAARRAGARDYKRNQLQWCK